MTSNNTPSSWALDRAWEWLHADTICRAQITEEAIDLAALLDVIYERGRVDREIEIVKWLRLAATDCGAYSGNSFNIAADIIETARRTHVR